MWHAPSGDRILNRAEARLFKSALKMTVAETQAELDGRKRDCWRSGIALFDRMTPPQRLAMLELVAGALLRRDAPAPELTAINEAAIAAILERLRDALQREAGQGESTELRSLLLDAVGGELDAAAPPADWPETEAWLPLLDCFEGRLLWDRDFEMADEFLDAEPERARSVKAFARIGDGYFTAIPPEPKARPRRQ